MVDITDYLIANIRELKQKIAQAEKYLQKVPEGYLRVNYRKNNITEYYYMIDGEQKYLSKKKSANIQLIKKLAEKSYYIKILPVLQKELKTSEKMMREYNPLKKYEIYKSMGDGRCSYVDPLFQTIEDRIKLWEEEEWHGNPNYPENLKFETNRGEKVRSKSEVIIADFLDMNRDICTYRYEAPLYLRRFNRWYYPDFTVMSKITGEIFYWEHFGMMDDEEYVKKCIGKINDYAMEGIISGVNAIYTFESLDCPLTKKVIKKIFYSYLMK